MIAVLRNLMRSSFSSPILPGAAIKYLTALGLLAVAAWPISDVVGRSGAPSAFSILVYSQIMAVPFLVNSFVTGRFNPDDRISIEDWVSYTPVPPLGVALAHTLWGAVLGLLMILLALPLTLVAMPLAGDTPRVLGAFAASTVAITAMASAFGYFVTAVVSSDWITSAATDAGYGMWTLLTMDGLMEFTPAKGFNIAALSSMLSPTKAAKAVLLTPHGIPWEIVAPLGATCILILLGGIAGSLIRYQGRSDADVGR